MKTHSWFKDWVQVHKHDETMFEAWQRLSGSSDPREVAGILSDQQAVVLIEQIESKGSDSNASRHKLREEFGANPS